MMFRTELNPGISDFSISYKHKILALGSCFVENIGERLKSLKYNIDINPFGIQYNPASIAIGIQRLLSGNLYHEDELFEYNGLWHSFDHHGNFSSLNRSDTLSQINTSLENSMQMLSKTNILFITLGTAWIYIQKENGNTVNNCHKVPQKEFVRKRLDTDEVYNLLIKSLSALIDFNSDIQIIITVSPVRHLKDGFIENQLSKATLLLAIEKLKNSLNNIFYFPSYELMMDDLRDYRFYAADMTHPNHFAIEYIWKKFETTFLLESEKQIRKEIEKIHQAIGHKILNPNSEAAKSFAESMLQKINTLANKLPDLDFSNERLHFELLK